MKNIKREKNQWFRLIDVKSKFPFEWIDFFFNFIGYDFQTDLWKFRAVNLILEIQGTMNNVQKIMNLVLFLLEFFLSFVEDFLSSGKDFPAISPCFCLKSLKNKIISNSPNTSSLAGDSWLMELSSRLALCLLPNRLGSHPINKE